MGSFAIALIYETKPNTSSSVTLSRKGDTAIVVDTGAASDSAHHLADSVVAVGPGEHPHDTVDAPSPAGPVNPAGTAGSSYPAVVPGDIVSLKAQAPVVPVAGKVAADLSDNFDEMRDGVRRHNAMDIMAARNTPVLSATSGTVLKLHNSRAGGLTVYAADPTNRFTLMYGHLDSYKPGIKEGDVLRRGDIIGFVGSTGNANPLAPHLHFAITRNDNMKDWWRGTPLNPFLVYRSK